MNFNRVLQAVWGPLSVSLRGNPSRRRSPRSTAGGIMELESRQLPSAIKLVSPKAMPSVDGTGNNEANPDWGSTGSDFIRMAEADYADGISSPKGTNRPSPRLISTTLSTQSGETESATGLSNLIYAWGQFLDHDIDLTNSADPAEAFNIAVPQGDPFFDPLNTGTVKIPLSRSKFNTETGTGAGNARQQINDITAFIDGSMIYGSDQATADSLRTFQGGLLKTSEGNLLPTDPSTADSSNPAFLAGDIRSNENLELTSLHTLFLREHNRIATELAKSNPRLTDEQLYQQARIRVIAEVQAITYNEFLPALIGQGAIPEYAGYDPSVNPGIANEFATAAYRVGHTLVGDDTEFLDDEGNEVRDPVALSEAFFNPNLLRETGIDSILKYLASDRAEEVDNQIVGSLQNFLFGPPGAGGLDLASLNIQRGRDHGLADYNSTREAYGLPKVTSFDEISSDPEIQAKLEELYGSVDNIDLWVGGLAEDHAPGSNLGETFTTIIADQFTRLRDGDRFYYENVFRRKELSALKSTTLADVIRRNTDLENLQDNVFFFQTSIQGTVFADLNNNGRLNAPDRGLAGRTVELLDDTGTVIDSTTTDDNGGYRFEGMALGRYAVREVLPDGATATNRPVLVAINRGGEYVVHLGESTPQNTPGRPPRSRTAAADSTASTAATLSDSLTRREQRRTRGLQMFLQDGTSATS